jgi:basic membrane lipoprotein Med (substrate-binding protein (PBP1-ABC) superfamily)
MGGDKLEIAYTENMFNVPDAGNAIRDYATDGYNLVIAHGAQYGTPLFEIAPTSRKSSFAWGTATRHRRGGRALTNVFAYEPRRQEGGYVNGVLAPDEPKRR